MRSQRKRTTSDLREREKTSKYHRQKRQKYLGVVCLCIALLLILVMLSSSPSFMAEEITWLAGILFVLLVLLFFWTFAKDFIKHRKYQNSPLSKVDKMTGYQFEDYLVAQFREAGYRVARIGGNHDFGADLLLRDGPVTYVVQAKRYRGSVGNQAVQQVVAAKAYYKADEAIIATNAWLTPAATELAKANGVFVINRKNIQRGDFLL